MKKVDGRCSDEFRIWVVFGKMFVMEKMVLTATTSKFVVWGSEEKCCLSAMEVIGLNWEQKALIERGSNSLRDSQMNTWNPQSHD